MVDSPGPTPRCLAGLTPATLKKLRAILVQERNADSELAEALDRLLDMTDKEIDLSEG